MSVFNRLSFQLKLLLSFVLIIVLTTVVGYYLIDRAVDRAFADFTTRSFQRQDLIFQQILGGYYERAGSWNGVERLFTRARELLPFVLVDAEGKVVIDPEHERIGEKVPREDLKYGVAIVVDGETVGTILPPPPTMHYRKSIEQGFLRTVSLALWIAAAAVGAIGILLSALLLRQLTGPLKRLDAAAQQIACGELSSRVPESSSDELGHLARSFNEMARSLEESEHAKQQMIADVSHELRTPISVVRTGLEGLRDGLLEPTPENFAALHNKILLTARLVSDLQQLALADAGQLSIKKDACDLGELVEQIRATIEVELEDMGIDLVIDLPADLPAVAADSQRVEQVLLNLLSNAERYTPEEGSIRISARVLAGGKVRVSICDSGPGLSDEDLVHIFDRFYRADKSRTRESGGAGLGLAIAKALVEAHGGRIWAENAPAGGACFHFTLPSA
ncbi:HAMP domain-containing protein [Candidatus Bipolaricaulota bacterium]|nr:HAMP domain-containing protein [Candidatus Bipolaricaulota bacterium]